MINTFLSSKLGKIVVNKEHFKQIIRANFNSYSYRLVKKTKEEQDIDEIIGKRILQHLKKFFYEKTNKTYKKGGRGIGNRTMKRTSK
jgi:phage major head subunit gpT-like protein